MRVHTEISVRQARASFAWMVRQVEKTGRAFIVTRDGEPAVAVVPRLVLEAYDAKSGVRARKVAALLKKLQRLMPGASR